MRPAIAACAAATMTPPGIANRADRLSASAAAATAARPAATAAVRTASGGTSSVRWTSGRWWMRGIRSRLIVIAIGPSHSSRSAPKNAGQLVAVAVAHDDVVDVGEHRDRVEQHQLADQRADRDGLLRPARVAASRLPSITQQALVPVRGGALEQQLLAEAALALDREHDLGRAHRGGGALDRDRRELAAALAGRAARRARRARGRDRAACRRAGGPAGSPRGSGGTAASRRARRARAAGSAPAASSCDRSRAISERVCGRVVDELREQAAVEAAARSDRARGSGRPATRFGSTSGSSANISVDHCRGVSSNTRIRSTSGERTPAASDAGSRASTSRCSCEPLASWLAFASRYSTRSHARRSSSRTWVAASGYSTYALSGSGAVCTTSSAFSALGSRSKVSHSASGCSAFWAGASLAAASAFI